MNFGTVTLQDGAWLVRCEPHVATRLKRVFPRAPQSAGAALRISNTPENSRELEWFLQRYPMTIASQEVLQAAAREHRDLEFRVAELLASRTPVKQIDLAKPAREYQLVAAALLEIKEGLLLGDDVGIGKTVTAICSIIDPVNMPALVVCPAHLPRHWCDKLAEFAPHLRVHHIRKGRPYPLVRQWDKRGQRDLWTETPDVLITSYHMLRGWADQLAGLIKLVVLDECQQLRHPDSEIGRAVRHVTSRARRRLGLSATPIYNYGGEFFHVVDAIVPGALGQHDEFIREWCVGRFDKARLSSSTEFGAYLRREGIMLRRTRKDVGRELPELQRIVYPVDTDEKLLAQLTGDAIVLARLVLARNESFRGERMTASGQFEALMRQATGIAKAPYVAEVVRLLLESGERVVLFGWHREMYRIWGERLKAYNPVYYTGTESAARKHEAVQRFRLPHTHWQSSRLLIMSLRSGAGVDGLQDAARTVVFGELDWSPGVHEQCMGRLHRDGQGEPVVAYYMVSDEQTDQVMADVLGIKREQIEGVRNPAASLIERIHTGEDNIKRLARDLLARNGEGPPEDPEISSLPGLDCDGEALLQTSAEVLPTGPRDSADGSFPEVPN